MAFLNSPTDMKCSSIDFDPNDEMLLTRNTGISNVEPNLALSPFEIVQRYASGNLGNIHVNDYYFDVPIDSPIIPDCDISFNDIRAMRSFVSDATLAAKRASEQAQIKKMKAAEEAKSEE